MVIDTRAIDFTLTDAIRRHVETRILGALGPLAHSVGRITARLEDVNADRGGVDKRCRLVAMVRRRRVLVIEARDGDLYAAVDVAAYRIRRKLTRLVKRRISRLRRPRSRPEMTL